MILIACLFRLMDSLKLFDSVYLLTGGGPGTATETLSFYTYWFGLGSNFQVGYGAAVSMLFLLLATLVSLAVLIPLRRHVEVLV